MKLQVLLLLGLTAGIISACQKETDYLLEEDALTVNEESALKSAHSNSNDAGFVHGIEIELDGEMYFFKGAPDGENGAIDVPGHYWVLAGKNRVVGKHFNTGPFEMSNWWSSDAKDGAYLYMVNGIIDTWSLEKAEAYYSRGYVHYHEFVLVADGTTEHPEKVIWLKHTAVTSFTLDGGPGAPGPLYEHEVTPGIDFEFPNNSFTAYNP
jgi:hypothetical protein